MRCGRSVGLLGLVGHFRDGDDLDLLVDGSGGVRGVQQLLLAQPHRLQALR